MTTTQSAADADETEHRPRIAYVMSRFPKLTETFILYEMMAIEQLGFDVDLYPLLRQREDVVQPEARGYVKRARYSGFISREILRSQLYWLRKRRSAYLGTLLAIIRGNWGSRNLLIGGLAIFPKVAHAARRMAADGVDHVHCHFATHPALAGFIVQRLTGIPYSFTAHGSDLHVDRHMLCPKVSESRFTVPISDYNRRLIIDECGEAIADKIVVIHCGVDTAQFTPVAKSEETMFRIVCVGTLHEVKGQTYLIEACRMLADAGVNFTCHLVGDGPDRAALTDQISSAGLDGRVHLEGLRTRPEIAELLSRADVLVAPSVPTKSGQREGIPVVLMEGMSSGIPVVASRLSGIPELVDHEVSGLLVPPRDARSLADALVCLATDRELRGRLGAAGRERVRADFDVAGNAARLAAEIRQRTLAPSR